MLWKIVGRRRIGHQRMKCLDGITDAMNMNLGKLWEMVRDREACCVAAHGVAKSWTQVETNSMLVYICLFKHTYIFRHI